MQKRFYFLLVLIAQNYWLYAINLDSLKLNVNRNANNQRLEQLLEISELYYQCYGQADSMLVFGLKAKTTAKEINNILGDINANIIIARAYARQNKIAESHKILQGILTSEKNKANSEIIGVVNYHEGWNFYFENDMEQAMLYFSEAARIFIETKSENNLALTYVRIAQLFSTENQIENCLDYIQKSLALVKNQAPSFDKMSVLSAASGQFVQIGSSQPEYLDSAIFYGKKALQIAISFEYYASITHLFNSISVAYSIQNNTDQAEFYLTQASTYSVYLGPNQRIVTLFNLTDFYFNSKNFTKSFQYLDSVYMVLQNFDDTYYKMIAAERTYEYYREVGQFEKALLGLADFKAMEDSLFSIEKNEKINDIATKYETELKDAEIENLNQKNELDELRIVLLIVAIGLTLVIFLFVVFLFRQRLFKQAQNLAIVEQRLGRARMNPHFFFNALTSIQAKVLISDNKPETASYISRLSKVMRFSLETTYNDLISIDEEIDFLKQYLDVQKFYLANKFDYTILLDSNDDIESYYIPSMLIQPFIENSIEHGFKNMAIKGSITINFSVKNNILKISISDNGSGIIDNTEKSRTSRASSIVQDRIFYLNQKRKTNASYTIENHANNKGVCVSIFLPLIFEP